MEPSFGILTADDYIRDRTEELARENEYVIYTNMAQIVIEGSNPKHEPDPADVAQFHTGTDTAGNWREIRITAAMLIIGAELAEAIEKLQKEAAAQD